MAFIFLFLAAPWSATAGVHPSPLPGPYVNGGLPDALRRLKRAAGIRILHVAAHPDDEDSAGIALLSLGRGARVAYLSLTRGEGGQNAIGPEMGEDLGIIRTGELLEARKADGALQYFGSMIDFGFSKSPEECFQKWGREEVVKDVVRAIRAFRPHIVLCRFQGTAADGHGQHQASALASFEAFDAAADPARFPELAAEGLKPWRALKLYAGTFEDGPEITVRLDPGEYDPLSGRSYAAIGYRGRSGHRSQDMGMIEYETPKRPSFYFLKATAPGIPVEEKDLYDNITLDLPAAAVELEKLFDTAGVLRDPSKLAHGLAEIMKAWRREASADGPALADLQGALAELMGLRLEAFAASADVHPGGAVRVECRAYAGHAGLVVNPHWTLIPSAGLTADPDAWSGAPEWAASAFKVTAAPDAPFTTPYYLREPSHNPNLYAWPRGSPAGEPFDSSPVKAVFAAEAHGVPIRLEVPVEHRSAHPNFGETRRDLAVTPRVSVRLEPERLFITSARQNPVFDVFFENQTAEPVQGEAFFEMEGMGRPPFKLAYDLPPFGARRVSPAIAPAETAASQGRLIPAAGQSLGDVREIRYPHLRTRTHVRRPESELVRLDLQIPAGLKVGYFQGPGERAGEALGAMGVDLEFIAPGDLGRIDLSRYTAVVIAARAYETNPALVEANARLLDFARAGGTLVVQYQKYEPFEIAKVAPFPVTLSHPHDRVTDETAAPEFLLPEDSLFHYPHRITKADFDGWVQERGLYFWATWPPECRAPLAFADPGEPPKAGGIVAAKVGQGTYIYTGLSFFRQLPAGNPGATRLFINLLSAGLEP